VGKKYVGEKNEKKKFYFFSRLHPLANPECPQNFSPIGPAVWPAIRNIYTNVLFYYIDIRKQGAGSKRTKDSPGTIVF